MKTTQSKVDRILARKVIHRGICHELSIIEINNCEVRVTPFEREIHSTRYVEQTVRILREGYESMTDWHTEGFLPVLIFE